MRLLPLLALLLPVAAHAADAPLIYKLFQSDTVLERNGQAVQTLHLEFRVTTDQAARQMSQQTLPFIDGQETAELVEATIRRADGRTVKLPPEAARPVPELGGTPAGTYDDRKRMAVLLPDLARGDNVAMTWRKRIQQPVFPGNYASQVSFSRLIEWQNADISLSAPADLAISTELRGVANESRLQGDRRILRWHYTGAAVPADPAALSPLDRQPVMYVSTFRDWPAFGRAWAALALPKTATTDTLRQRADAITEGRTDKREQAQAIYAWLQKNIRYVPLALGQGGFEPSPAESVLSRGYGDTKDQAILAIALLKAKGIPATPVLVNNANSYTLPKTPNFVSLNHVVVFLPDWSIHFDPTSLGTPFGMLPFLEYGKQSLRIGADTASIEPIPPLPERLAGERVVTKMTLDATGRVQGETVSEALGPFAGDLRRTATAVRNAGAERTAAGQLRAAGLEGAGAFTGPDPAGVTPAYAVRATFELPRQRGWLEGDAFVLSAALRLVYRPGDVLLGALENRDLPAEEATPCFSGRQEEDLTLAFPPGNHIARPPKDLKIENDAFVYASTWTVEAASIRVHRVLETRIQAALCAGKLRADVAEALPRMRRDMAARIWFEQD